MTLITIIKRIDPRREPCHIQLVIFADHDVYVKFSIFLIHLNNMMSMASNALLKLKKDRLFYYFRGKNIRENFIEE